MTMPVGGYGAGQIPNAKVWGNPGAFLTLTVGLGVLFIPLFLYGLFKFFKHFNTKVYCICVLMILAIGLFEYLDSTPKMFHLLSVLPAFFIIDNIGEK